MTNTNISIDAIDLRNDQFQISYMADHHRLTESIGQIGLIHPVVLRSTPPTEHYQIVSGFQRVKSCLELKFNQINGVVYRQDELPDSQAIVLALHQTATSRPLNLIEKSLALRKLISVGQLSGKEIMSNIMPVLDLEPNVKIFKNVSELWELTDDLKAYIVQKNVALNNAIMFLNFNEEDQNDLHKLISPLKLGTNRLKEFLVMIDEMCHRDEIPVHGIIDEEMNTILTNPDMPTPQKTEAIRSQLRQKRFPKISSLEKDIQEKLKQLKLPPNLALSPPPFLEGDRMKVQFEFKNREDLDKIIRKLAEISDDDALTALLDML